MKNIVILISGRGSNMEAIVRAREAQQWPARIAAVISNKPDAAEFWAEKKVPFRVFYSFEEPQSLQSVGWVGARPFE